MKRERERRVEWQERSRYSNGAILNNECMYLKIFTKVDYNPSGAVCELYTVIAHYSFLGLFNCMTFLSIHF